MNCSTWNDLLKNPGFLMVLNSHLAASVLSIIISAIVIVKCGHLAFHVNCKILILTMLALYILHSIITIVLQVKALHEPLRKLYVAKVYQVGNYITLQSLCEFLIPAYVCFILRFSGSFCLISFAILQFAMVAERCVALWKRSKYETFGKKLGFSFAFVSVLAGLAIASWTTRVEEFSALPYCTPSSPRAVERITGLSYLLCSINVITLVGLAILFTGNHIAIKSKRFDLCSSYQLAENYSVLKLLLPLSIFQSICYAFFTVSSGVLTILVNKFDYITFRMLFLLIYVIPFYTVISPIMIWNMISKSQRLKAIKLKQVVQHDSKVDDIYFGAYLKMW